jgi:hypothetical protein
MRNLLYALSPSCQDIAIRISSNCVDLFEGTEVGDCMGPVTVIFVYLSKC